MLVNRRIRQIHTETYERKDCLPFGKLYEIVSSYFYEEACNIVQKARRANLLFYYQQLD